MLQQTTCLVLRWIYQNHNTAYKCDITVRTMFTVAHCCFFFFFEQAVAHRCNNKHAQYSHAWYRYFSSRYNLHVKASYSGLTAILGIIVNRNIVQKSKLCIVYKKVHFKLYFELTIRHLCVENDTFISFALSWNLETQGPKIQLLIHITNFKK